ncbi:hypothetical protein DENSPDRAFT_835276 [Dentipellis sp. KUC8613]|nr:hypothetical protein DENSPDRAFT_835276 [Dentipellis sp. KUC8613]
MANYEQLPNGDEHLSEEHGLVSEKYEGRPSFASAASSLKPFVLALLLLNIILAGTNVWATNLLSSHVAKVAPIADIAQLPVPDQYTGLSSSSRQKMVHTNDSTYIRKRDPADFMRNPL